jgi:Aspartyl protease
MRKAAAHKGVKMTIQPLEGGGYHLFITVVIEGFRARLLVDTGASKCVIDKDFYEKKLARKMKVIQQETTGLHSTVMESYTGKLKTLEIGTLALKQYEIAGVDLSHVNDAYRKMKLKRIDGILGSDLLLEHGMVIDYPQSKILF